MAIAALVLAEEEKRKRKTPPARTAASKKRERKEERRVPTLCCVPSRRKGENRSFKREGEGKALVFDRRSKRGKGAGRKKGEKKHLPFGCQKERGETSRSPGGRREGGKRVESGRSAPVETPLKPHRWEKKRRRNGFTKNLSNRRGKKKRRRGVRIWKK